MKCGAPQQRGDGREKENNVQQRGRARSGERQWKVMPTLASYCSRNKATSQATYLPTQLYRCKMKGSLRVTLRLAATLPSTLHPNSSQPFYRTPYTMQYSISSTCTYEVSLEIIFYSLMAAERLDIKHR